MNGQVLDFSVQTNNGVISGDDGNRYSFTGADWQISAAPRRGIRVDFDPDGATATGIYAEAGADVATVMNAAPVGVVQNNVAISTMGIVGTYLGILAIVFFQTDLLCFPLMLCGLGLSVAGLTTGKQRGERVGFAIAGIALSAVPFFLDAIIAVAIAAGWGFDGVVKSIASNVLPFM